MQVYNHHVLLFQSVLRNAFHLFDPLGSEAWHPFSMELGSLQEQDLSLFLCPHVKPQQCGTAPALEMCWKSRFSSGLQPADMLTKLITVGALPLAAFPFYPSHPIMDFFPPLLFSSLNTPKLQFIFPPSAADGEFSLYLLTHGTSQHFCLQIQQFI